ncbi:MAG: hypothetical protein QNI90_18285 [Dinoroseobacter sp.]|nr:hypothetical protein [Dinoroseobacter sp.]
MKTNTTLPMIAVSCTLLIPTTATAISIDDVRKTETPVMAVSDRQTPQSLREAWDMFRNDVRQAGEEIMSVSDSWSDRDEDDDYDDYDGRDDYDDRDDYEDDDDSDDRDDSDDDGDDDGDDD